MIINHNITALNTHRQMSSASSAQANSMEKLSSGLRINSAKDDAAGLSISEKMRGQIRGLEQASKNSQDAISLMQTAEGALNETHDILQRMRELSVQSANDTNTADDRAEIQKEISQLTEEVDRIANTTEFNSKKLLTGEIGTKTDDSQNITGLSMTSATKAGTLTFDTNATLATKAIGELTLVTNSVQTSGSLNIEANGKTYNIGTTLGQSFESLAKQITSTVDGLTATWDASTNKLKFESNVANADQVFSVSEATPSSLDGATDFTAGAGDLADVKGTNATGLTSSEATFSFVGNKVTVTGGEKFEGLTFTLKADSDDDTLATLINSTIDVSDQLTMQIGSNAGQELSININAMDSTNLGVNSLDVTTQEGASAAITNIDAAIKSVSSERSKLGAFQNRLDHTINNLNTSAENLTSAESRIRDVDYAEAA